MAFFLLGFIVILLGTLPYKRILTISGERFDIINIAERQFVSSKTEFDINSSPNLMVLAESLNMAVIKEGNRTRKITWCGVSNKKYFTIMLLLLAGDVSMNPGPRKAQFPCVTCNYAVGAKQRSIQCDCCNKWTHFKCIPNMTVKEYNALGESNEPWYCIKHVPTPTTTHEQSLNELQCDAPETEEHTDIFDFTDSFFHSSEIDINENQNESIISSLDTCNTSGVSDSNDEDSDDGTKATDAITQRLSELKIKHRNKPIMAYLNINSYRYKTCDIIDLLNKQQLDIMCIAETKLDQSFPDSQFMASNFVIY